MSLDTVNFELELYMVDEPLPGGDNEEVQRGTRSVMMGAVIFSILFIFVMFGWFLIGPHIR